MRTTSSLLLVPCLAVTLAACGNDDDAPPPPDFEPVATTPLTLSNANRGLHVYFSTALTANKATFEDRGAHADNIVIVDQIFSENVAAQVGPTDTSSPRFDSRIEFIREHADLAPTIDAAAHTYYVVDLQRLDREWLVDWRGGERDLPENRPDSLNFARTDDYTAEVIDTIIDSFAGGDFTPTSLIIGYEMERYYHQNPDDWGNFVAFVRALDSQMSEFYPDVRLGVGINFSNFMDTIVPEFRPAEFEGSGRSYEAFLAAWVTVLDPLYYDAETMTPLLDFYAFSSIPDPALYSGAASVDEQHYAGIATLFGEEPERALPVAWFSIGWPQQQAASAEFGAFFNRFLKLNGGYQVELVSWFGFTHLLSSDCNRLISALNGINAPDNICNRGLFNTSGGDVGTLTDSFFGGE